MVMKVVSRGASTVAAATETPSVPSTVAGTSWGTASMPR